MRSRGFLLFELKHYCVSCKNPLAVRGKHQPLWCEAVWLFDFVGRKKVPDREQAIKALVIGNR